MFKGFYNDIQPPPALLLQCFGPPWVSCYISEVRKYFTGWLYVLQAMLNTRSVLVEVAITYLSVVLSARKANGISNNTNNTHIPVSAVAESCHSQEAERLYSLTHTRATKAPFTHARFPWTFLKFTWEGCLCLHKHCRFSSWALLLTPPVSCPGSRNDITGGLRTCCLLCK